MTDTQIKYVSNFWADRLRESPQVSEEQADTFRKALTVTINKLQSKAVTFNPTPATTLRAALKVAGIADMFPRTGPVEVIMLDNGTVQIWEKNQWRTVTPR